MAIELSEESYIVGVWYSSCPKTNNNWLACFVKNPENPKKYKGWSRFRYSNGPEIFDGHDEKSWTALSSNDENKTDEDIIEFMDKMQNLIEAGYPEKDQIIVKGGLEKLIELSKDKPWMHMRVEDKY